jgi:formiminotetrahydrofolate cyclodeaminase
MDGLMARFVDLHLSQFLDALASADPTPGGGTAAAMAGAMGTSLLMMVAGLAKSRNGTDEERAALSEARAALAGARERLITLADTDTEAFNQVMTAYRLAKGTDEEKAARKAAIQQGLKAATLAPLETLRAAAEAMRLAVIVARGGNRTAISDVGVGVGLLEAAADGAIANVRINLTSVQDAAFVSSTTLDVETLSARLSSDAATARNALAG